MEDRLAKVRVQIRMNTDTGEIHELPNDFKNLVPVVRDLTEVEKLNHQIMLYSPCGCGSGKKFKFCCHTPRKI